MNIFLNSPDDDGYITEVREEICEFHKKHPTIPAPPWVDSCGCSCVYVQRQATPEERQANKEKREKYESEKHLAWSKYFPLPLSCYATP